MARRQDSIDLSDSLVDLCCCALGGFIVLMVIVVPESTERAIIEDRPVERPIVFQLTIPIPRSVDEAPTIAYPERKNCIYPLSAGQLFARFTLNDVAIVDQELRVGETVSIPANRGVQNVDVTVVQEACDPEWIRKTLRDNDDDHYVDKSQLTVRVLIVMPPTEDDLWRVDGENHKVDFSLECRLVAQSHLFPSSVSALWTNLCNYYDDLNSPAANPTPAFPSATATIFPEGESARATLKAVPVAFVAANSSADTLAACEIGLLYASQDLVEKGQRRIFPLNALYADEKDYDWTMGNSADKPDGTRWRRSGANFYLPHESPTHVEFGIKWIGRIILSSSENDDESGPTAAVSMEVAPVESRTIASGGP